MVNFLFQLSDEKHLKKRPSQYTMNSMSMQKKITHIINQL